VWSLAVTGCVSTNAAVLDKSISYQKICPDGVMLFTSAERVPEPYAEVALLNSSGESNWTTEQGMMHSQQQKAAQLGANGIIVGDTREPNAGTKIIGSLLGTGAERKGKAVAIFIPSDTLRVQRVCKTTPRQLNAAYQEPEAPPAPNAMGGPAPAPGIEKATQPAVERAPDPVVERAPGPVHEQAQPAQPAVEDRPVAGFDRLPAGTNYIGDVRIKTYYPIGCAALHAIPADAQVFFQTEAGAMDDGFQPSGDC
jgi:hypothetical protein